MKSRVRVTVVLEIECVDSWQTGCTLEQVIKDAKRNAQGVVSQMVNPQPRVHQVGELKVNAAIAEEL